MGIQSSNFAPSSGALKRFFEVLAIVTQVFSIRDGHLKNVNRQIGVDFTIKGQKCRSPWMVLVTVFDSTKLLLKERLSGRTTRVRE
jgi:hypothetical protein